MRRLLLLSLCLVGTAVAGDHVRVILDNSGSMVNNDRPRLAALATLLLYDLADPNLTRDNSFDVFTFDSTWPSRKWQSGPPPVQNGPRIKALPGRRAALADALKAIPYNSRNTYYYPVLEEAISDLKATPGGLTDRRVIVLITDGLPEDPDTSLIARDLLSELTPNHIRLYVIAFGPEAIGQERQLRTILSGPGVTDILVDSNGSNLLSSMIQIFSRSFGYSSEPPVTVNGPTPLILDSGQGPARVAVVSYWRNPIAPGLNVNPPSRGLFNVPEGLQSGQEAGASYRAAWVIRPNTGAYQLSPDSMGASVAILRPATVLMSVIPQPPLLQCQITMATKEFPMRVAIHLPGGVRGDPGEDLKFSSQTHGPSTVKGYEWDGSVEGASIPTGTAGAGGDGRYYDIAPKFHPDTVEGREFYEGWLTTEVARGEATLGSARQRVLVYPYMRLSPIPPVQSAMVGRQVQPIRSRQTGCAGFEFRQEGSLSHSSYALRAVIDKRLMDDPRLVQARYTLDGIALDYADSPSPNPSDWYAGRRLSKAALLGSHEFCITVGKPRSGEPGPAVDIPLQFTLMEAPYDSMQAVDPIVEPMRLHALIAPPSFLDRYGSWVALGLGLLTVLLIAWYTRYRATVPPALRWAVAPRNSSSGPVPAILGDGPMLPRLLGLRSDRVAYVDNGAWALGRVRPADDDLYEFHPAPGVSLESAEEGDGGSLHLLAVRRNYFARTPDHGEYVFRLEYE